MPFKSILSLFLVCALLLSFTSCGAKEQPSTTAPTPTESQTFSEIEKELITVSIPEGYTLLRLSWLLEKKGICSSAAFLEAAEQYDLSKFPVLQDVKNRSDVCFPLEGYLFPATYQFKKNTAPTKVLDELVKTANGRFQGLLENGKSEQGYTLHEILTIASIIEKEAFTSEQRSKISAVLHNRLKQGMPLQCDVTIKYCEGVIKVQYPEKFDKMRYLYNTYKCKALPAGPICNPGMESIEAALHPADIDALYFVIATEPPYESRFSKDYNEHLKNCKELGY